MQRMLIEKNNSYWKFISNGLKEHPLNPNLNELDEKSTNYSLKVGNVLFVSWN